MLDSIRLPLTSVGIVGTAVLLSASSAMAQDGEEAAFDRTPKQCIAVARVRNTDVIDDRTIIFYLRGNKEVYRAHLPHECPGLQRNERFAYEARNGQLCNVDTITVLEQFGAQLNPTFTCRLGDFIPITREEAEDLKLEQEGDQLKRRAITAEPAEVPPEAEGQATETDGAADEAASKAPAEEAPKKSRRGSGITAR